MRSALALAALIVAPAPSAPPRNWTSSDVAFELSPRGFAARRSGDVLFSTEGLLADAQAAFDADARERAAELLGEDAPQLPTYDYEVQVAYQPVSVVGHLVTLLEAGEGYAPGAAHPYAYQRFVVRDVTRPDRRPSLLDFYTEAEIVSALRGDAWIRGFTPPGKELPAADSLAALAAQLNDARDAASAHEHTCDRDAFFSERLVESFAFHHLSGDRVAVRVGIPYAIELCRPRLHQVGLLLPLPDVLRADLQAAAQGRAGFLMDRADAPRFAREFRADLRALSRTLRSATGAAPEAGRAAVLAEVDGLAPEIARVSEQLWAFSETALRETRSAALLADLLEREGFRVERGVAGMPTAFVATWGRGEPVLGILAEYDALPGVGNAAVPRQQAREDGVTSGQGCGHNLFGAGSVGAALALQRTMKARSLPGTLRVFGTPAEETVVGKAYMARDGVFDGLSAVLEWHPDVRNAVNNMPNQALNNFTVEFRGKAAHAAADPWRGRSALDAVELFTHGVNLMREHVRPTARVHYVLPSAGEAPNVVPAYAKVWLYVRDTEREAVDAHYAWLLKIAEGAALATGTTHTVTLVTGVHEYNFNRPLQEAMQAHLEAVGAPDWSEEEHAFARALQKGAGIAETGLATDVRPLAAGLEPPEGGSTDVAEVSHLAPTVGLLLATAGKDLPWHSWAIAASHGQPGASKGAITAARILALTGLDVLTRKELRAAARADFETRRGGRPYRSPIPAGQKPPLP